jgi:HSP20 family protein
MTTQSSVEEELRSFLSDDTVLQPIASNLIETWSQYHLQLALPAVDLSDVEIDVLARVVTVAGSCRLPIVESGEMVWRQIANGSFRCSFDLPGPVDGDRATASFERGILTVHLPKLSYLQPSRVPIDLTETVR